MFTFKMRLRGQLVTFPARQLIHPQAGQAARLIKPRPVFRLLILRAGRKVIPQQAQTPLLLLLVRHWQRISMMRSRPEHRREQIHRERRQVWFSPVLLCICSRGRPRMTTYIPAKKNTEYIFYAGLVSQSTGQFQSNPTLATGDFKVSIDGGALNNLATLPAVTPASSRMVKFTLSTSEMNGDNITVMGVDAAGSEWDEVIVSIQTAAKQIDDLASQTSVDDLP